MFFDSFAWIEYFQGSDRGKTVMRMLDDAPVSYTAPIVLAEIFSRVARTEGIAAAETAVQTILERCAVVHADEELGITAGRIHAEEKRRKPTFGMADAFVLASARARNVKVLTGDPHFKDIQDALILTE